MYDNQEHYHNSDRFPSRDTLMWLNSLENVRRIGDDYTMSDDDDYLIVDTTAGDVMITLPTPLNGRKLVIANFTGANDVVLTATTDINGSASNFIVMSGVTVNAKDIVNEWLVW